VIYEGARITSRLLCEDFGVQLPGAEGKGMESSALHNSDGGFAEGWQEAARVASGPLPEAV
jgi:hypothetical protein